ncbi:hypothetical protein ABVL22_004324 [Salmonella enterica]
MKRNKRFSAPIRKGMTVTNLKKESVGVIIPMLNHYVPTVFVIDPLYEPEFAIKGGKA